MKSQLLTTIIVTTGIILTSFSSHSQEQSDCFMLDANGNPVSLGDLCPDNNLQTPNGSNPGFFSIPIKRRESNLVVVDVIFNGSYTFEMFLDTGASGTVLTPEMAETLKLQPEGTTRVSTAGGIVTAPLARIKSMAAGGLTANDVLVVVSPHIPIGLLGQDFFGNYDLTIRENVIEFHERK